MNSISEHEDSEDFARIGFFLSTGGIVRDRLVVHRGRLALLRGGELLNFEGYFMDGFLKPLAPCGEFLDLRCRRRK